MQDGFKFGSLDQLFFFSNFRINWIMPLLANRVGALYRICQEWVCNSFHIPAVLMTDSFWPFPGLFLCSWPCPGFTHLPWSLRLLKNIKGWTKSKWFFQADGSSKKWMNEFNFTTTYDTLGWLVFIRFFRRNWRHLKDISKSTDL